MTKTKASQWILLVAGGLLQLPALKAAHNLGYQVIVTDRNSDCACAALADKFIKLDTFDVAGYVRFVKECGLDIAAVFTAAADPVVTVARAAEVAGCHGLPWEIALRCTNKLATRMILADRYVPQPVFFQVYNCDRLGEIGYNLANNELIVKATGSSGSRGHTQCNGSQLLDYDFCKAAYERAIEFSHGSSILVEEWLDGVILSVETLWYNGAMIPLNAVERPHDGIIELGHYNPWCGGDDNQCRAVWDTMRWSGNAIGMDDTTGGHILKGDLVLTDDGPKVLELTPRLSGGFDSGWTSPLAHGTNYTEGALRLALGQPLEWAMPDFTPLWRKHAVCFAVMVKPGTIKEIQGLDKARQYAEVILRYNVGDTVPPLEDCTSRAAFVIAAEMSHEDAWGIVVSAWTRLEFVMEQTE